MRQLTFIGVYGTLALFLLSVLTVGNIAGDDAFEYNTILNTDNRPFSLSIGDLNNDDLNDIAVANFYSGSITIYYQHSNNSFLSTPDARLLTKFGEPYSIDIGDLNNDGLNDILVSKLFENAVEIFYQRANNMFNIYGDVRISAYGGPYSVDIGDLNNDGLNDFVIAHGYSNEITVYYQNADNSFDYRPDRTLFAGKWPTTITINDLNNDGLNDLAVSNFYSCTIGIYYQRIDNEFPLMANAHLNTENVASSVTTDDLNEDGLFDIIVTVSREDAVLIYFQKQDNTFSPQVDIKLSAGDYTIRATTGDFNGDSLKDIISSNFYSDEITIHFQRLNGEFYQYPDASLPTQSGPWGILAGDLNDDQLQDIAVTNRDSNTVGIYYQGIYDPDKYTFNIPPVPIIEWSKNYTNVFEITFDGSKSYDIDGTIENYLWELGDGTNKSGQIFIHEYAEEGNYTVTLTVIDDKNAKSTKSVNVTIEDKEKPSVQAGNQEMSNDLPMNKYIEYNPILFMIASILILFYYYKIRKNSLKQKKLH